MKLFNDSNKIADPMRPGFPPQQPHPLRGVAWSDVQPGEVGWYWACNFGANDGQYVRVDADAGRWLVVYLAGSSNAHALDLFNRWLGPLPDPAPPPT